MKKLMIALGVAAVAAGVQAASYQWSETTGITVVGSVTEATPDGSFYSAGKVYLIDAGKYSQQAFFNALAATPNWDMTKVTSLATENAYNSATLSAAKKFGTVEKGELSSGKASWDPTTDGYTAGSTYNFYQVLVDGDSFYITDSVAAPLSGTGTSYIKFANAESFDYNAAVALPATFEHGGWYTAVPEPTSGLLLLLGVAGLALRRRRA